MGLDAYVEVRSENYGVDGCFDKVELWYGRKEWHIQHWMANEYHNLFSDDGTGFNLQTLPLTKELIAKLQADFVAGTLLGEEGCFNGINEGQQEAVLKLITTVTASLLAGESPVYTAWY